MRTFNLLMGTLLLATTVATSAAAFHTPLGGLWLLLVASSGWQGSWAGEYLAKAALGEEPAVADGRK